MARFRSVNGRSLVTGSYYNYLATPKTSYRTVQMGLVSECTDVEDNPGGNNPLTVLHKDRWTSRLDGTLYQSDGVTINKKFDGYPITYVPNLAPVLDEYPVPDAGALWSYGNAIMARCNPNVASQNLPQAIGELKDLPSMVRGFGSRLLTEMRRLRSGRYRRKILERVSNGRRLSDIFKDPASGHLSWRFGIAPMISDITKLFQFQDQVARRVKMLEKLRDGKDLHRRCTFDSSHRTTPWGEPFIAHSNGAIVWMRMRVQYTSRVWGTVRFRVVPGTPLPRTESRLKWLATRLVGGLNSHSALAAAWQLMPWTWLSDWFWDVGEKIASANNTVPVEYTHMCLCRTLTSSVEHEVTSKPSWVSVNEPAYFDVVRKERYPCAPGVLPSISLPLVDASKWSILGSLAALRWR